jgi:hypothetical protein
MESMNRSSSVDLGFFCRIARDSVHDCREELFEFEVCPQRVEGIQFPARHARVSRR